MSRVCKPVRAAGTGAYGCGHGLRFCNPHPTRTRDAGTAGFVHKAAGFVHEVEVQTSVTIEHFFPIKNCEIESSSTSRTLINTA